MTSIILTVALIGSIVIILMNKMSQRPQIEPLPELDSLESKQNYLYKIQQNSRLDSQEWLLIMFSYFVLENQIKIESVQQAQQWVQTQSPDAISNQMAEMMKDENFLDTMIADLPDELQATAQVDSVYSNEETNGDFSDGGTDA